MDNPMIASEPLLQRSKNLGYWGAEGMRPPRSFDYGMLWRGGDPIIPLKRVVEGSWGLHDPSKWGCVFGGARTHCPGGDM